MTERCNICDKNIAPGESVTRCCVSKTAGEWRHVVEHIDCINARPGEYMFTCGPVFTIGDDDSSVGPYTSCPACNGTGCDRCMPSTDEGE